MEELAGDLLLLPSLDDAQLRSRASTIRASARVTADRTRTLAKRLQAECVALWRGAAWAGAWGCISARFGELFHCISLVSSSLGGSLCPLCSRQQERACIEALVYTWWW
jgi:hypothetical protein